MKTLYILLLIPLLSFSQNELFFNSSFGADKSGDLLSFVGFEYYFTENISSDINLIEKGKYTNATLNINYSILNKPNYSIVPKVGISYFINPTVGLSTYYQIFNNIYLSGNAVKIFNDKDFYSFTAGISINLTSICFKSNYK